MASLGLSRALCRTMGMRSSLDTRATQTKLVTGDPVGSLLAVAQEVGANLICAGTTGKRSIETLLIDSGSGSRAATTELDRRDEPFRLHREHGATHRSQNGFCGVAHE